MSPADHERAARGEDVFAPRVEPGYLGDDEPPQGREGAPGSGSGRAGGSSGSAGAGGARDADLLREVPPHWFGGRGS